MSDAESWLRRWMKRVGEQASAKPEPPPAARDPREQVRQLWETSLDSTPKHPVVPRAPSQSSVRAQQFLQLIEMVNNGVIRPEEAVREMDRLNRIDTARLVYADTGMTAEDLVKQMRRLGSGSMMPPNTHVVIQHPEEPVDVRAEQATFEQAAAELEED